MGYVVWDVRTPRGTKRGLLSLVYKMGMGESKGGPTPDPTKPKCGGFLGQSGAASFGHRVEPR